MSIPVVSVAQMRSWEEATWESGQSVEVVMRQAGRAVADAARRMTAPAAPVLVLAGKGNNGGDARFAAEGLDDRKTLLIECADEGVTLAAIREELEGAAIRDGLVIDGLFGIGLNRPAAGRWAHIIEAVNASGARVLAVDIPSGLSGDDGSRSGPVIAAEATLTFGAPKTGLLAAGAEEFVGRLEVAAEIGLIPCPFTGDVLWIEGDDFRGFPPRRPVGGHKGGHGHVAVLAGSTGYHGAAVLAARGAQRAMPGLISLYTTERVHAPVAAQLRQSMVHPWTPQSDLPAKTTAVLVGPGLAGPDVDETLIERTRTLWRESPLTVVADASALDWLEPGDTAGPRVMTPHPGEAARLLGIGAAEVQADRVTAARELRARFGGIVVLKGHHTLVAAADGITINDTGNPYLGQGGSGDALAGYIAGLLAQPALSRDPAKAIRFAVRQHGQTADRLTRSHHAWDLDDFLALLGNAGESH